jgi:hypothetical protein
MERNNVSTQPSLRQLLLVISTASALCCGTRGAAAGLPVATAPAYKEVTPYLSLPPSFEDRLIYYHGFERDDGEPEVNVAGVRQRGRLLAGANGIRGRCAAAGKPQILQLHSPAFSPHRPLSVAFWWAPQRDPQPETCFGLFHLAGGRRYISHFSRGKGTWCALKRPAAILQVYNFPEIRNINGIYDRDLRAHLELGAGAWHHTAVVFNGASLIEVYTDGLRAWSVRLRGGSFAASDRLHDLVIGSRDGVPMALDEMIVLRRALTAGELGTYVVAIRQMRAVHYP